MLEEDKPPVVNIGGSFHYHIKKGKRPKELYIRVTQAILKDIGETEFKQKRFLDWLFKGVLPSLDK